MPKENQQPGETHLWITRDKNPETGNTSVAYLWSEKPRYVGEMYRGKTGKLIRTIRLEEADLYIGRRINRGEMVVLLLQEVAPRKRGD